MDKQKITIITGSNSGIGKKSLRKFAQEGHHVIMGCRDLESANEAKKEVLKEFPQAKITVFHLDLADFSSVKNFCRQVKDNFSYINNLIHNAGVFNHGLTEFQKTVDGYELTYQVNLLSPHILNQLLSPLLMKSQSPKVIYASTTNIKYFFDPKRKVNLDDIKPHDRPYNSYKMYGDSKICQLALIFMDSGLPTEILQTAVMIPAVKIDKRSRKRLKPFFRFMAFLQYPFALSQETIADCYYYLSESNLNKTVINSKKEIVKPVGYSDSPKEQVKNIISDKTFPNYCMKEDLIKGLRVLLTGELNIDK
ncbi:MAG: SDR family NAD(P)-dependent oxidoreductase [Leptospira sp.]|nr:SDR family NAD(P)-dependent oxidoreductase [Leptospira sp.]